MRSTIVSAVLFRGMVAVRVDDPVDRAPDASARLTPTRAYDELFGAAARWWKYRPATRNGTAGPNVDTVVSRRAAE